MEPVMLYPVEIDYALWAAIAAYFFIKLLP